MAVTSSARGPTILNIVSTSVEAGNGRSLLVSELVLLCAACVVVGASANGAAPYLQVLLHSASKHGLISRGYVPKLSNTGHLERQVMAKCILTCNSRAERRPTHADMPGSVDQCEVQ